ncbi:zinc finger protein Xfin-like [Ostrea edulis]|uniref:zinc finger protein Xfin-like n=1 Tax=Ostrea edulis TaxID=37623 RepID=UPI0024AFFBD2|nr:zinc finger protein Xfin-like [Ostrea edulis]
MSGSSGRERYPCQQCKRSYTRKHDMERHVYISHTITTDKPFMCEKCNFVFTSEENLKDHKIDHSEKIKFQCEICEKSFKNSNTWKRHTRAHIDPKPFICQICKRKFGREHDMRRHVIRMHSGERRYQCDLCPSKFAWFSDLRIHKRRHSHMRKFITRRTGSKKSRKKIHFKNKKQKAQQVSSVEHVCRMRSLSFTSFSSLQLHTCDSGSSAIEEEALRITHSCLCCERHFESSSALQFHSCDKKSTSDNAENKTTFADSKAQTGDSGETINDKNDDSTNVIKSFMENSDRKIPVSENSLQSSDASSSAMNPCSPENVEQLDEIKHVECIIVKKWETKSNDNAHCSGYPKSFTTLSVPQHHSCADRNETTGDQIKKQNIHSVPANNEPNVQNSEQSLVNTGQLTTDEDLRSDVNSTKASKSGYMKCKVCQKVFSKFSALQLHLCEESLEDEEILKIPIQNAEKSEGILTRSSTVLKQKTTPRKKHSLKKHKKSVAGTITRHREMNRKKSKGEDRINSPEDKPIQSHHCGNCGQTFKHKKDLTRHELRHKNTEPTFRRSGRDRHMETVHPVEAPYRCKLCEAAFTSAELLQKHMPDHAKTHPYVF